MININLRREEPMANVNRILAIESLVKYYPIDIVEEVDSRVIHSWIELNDKEEEIEVKQINLAYVLFGLPTAELHHLMVKLEKKVLKEDVLPVPEESVLSDIMKEDRYAGLTNRQKLQKEWEEKQLLQAQIAQQQDGKIVEEDKPESDLKIVH